MTGTKIGLMGVLFLMLSLSAYSAIGNPTEILAFNKGMAYLQNSPPEIWNATDFAAYSIIQKNFPTTMNPINPIMDSKKTFSTEQYPFTASLLKPVPLHPSDFEIGLITPVQINKIYTCESLSPIEFMEYSNKKNSEQNPYDASHAVLFLSYIKKYYLANCSKPDQTTSANQNLPLALSGLNIMPNFYDAYLEQECARGLGTGFVKPEVLQLVLSTQDLETGGWWHQGKKVNPDWFDEINGKIISGEYPNGHTTMFAMCILAVSQGYQ